MAYGTVSTFRLRCGPLDRLNELPHRINRRCVCGQLPLAGLYGVMELSARTELPDVAAGGTASQDDLMACVDQAPPRQATAL